MTEKLYYWAENLENYTSDNEIDYDQVIEIKRLNFFIGKNNSGKSRFLRSLFSHNYPSRYFSFIDILNYLKQVEELIAKTDFSLYEDNLSDIKRFLRVFKQDIAQGKSDQILYYFSSLEQIFAKIANSYRPDLHSKIELEQENIAEIDSLFTDKYYIPILRGMRPVTDINNRQPYIERAQKDYFSDSEKFNAKNIITGECLYYELQTHLLGRPNQRELIKRYEEKLSQYFFDNQTITLIPYIGKDDNGHANDVVHIKIGDDDQFPIYKLGDGLQQAIILTYEAFIKKDETHAFFIEEPELHMHAGMVRQLMNFYLNETPHYYFFTTHSNHLLDMVDESHEVIIQKFVKIPNTTHQYKFDFKIYRCDRDHELLTSLGVRPSSVYLANCTIWVEGVTDRMYLSKLMEKYIQELEASTESDNITKAKKYRSFMPNFHYAFVEYAGGNITHWSFLDDYPTKKEALEFLENNKGLTAKAISKNILLLADGDNEGKAERLLEWRAELSEDNIYILSCKEIENTLCPSIIYKACLIKFHGTHNSNIQSLLTKQTIVSINKKGFNSKTDLKPFNISRLSDTINFVSKKGIGEIIDNIIRLDNTVKLDKQNKPIPLPRLFSDASGTIADKVSFCEICKTLMSYENWQLTQQAKELCEKIFTHIEKCNS